MYSVREQLTGELDEIRAAGLFKAERVIKSPQQATVARRRRRGPELLRQQLPRARRPPGADRGRPDGAGPLGLRHGVRALHLRHAGDPQGARGEDLELPGPGGHDPLRLVLRRQRRAVRDAARARGRRDQRRAEPRVDHRRHPAVQGPALPLRELRHGRAGGAPEGLGRRAAAPDRHRRRLLHGRLRRQAGRDLRPRGEATTRWSWSTTRTPSASWARAAAARPSSRA